MDQDAGARRIGSRGSRTAGADRLPPPSRAVTRDYGTALRPGGGRGRSKIAAMYFTDRGIEELEKRRGEEEVSFEWLAEQLRTFVDLNPDFEVPVERLATWLARLDDDEDEDA
ncbi:hypothetical protein EES39_18855 [Streptomyces sp. ADI92-24]|nr:hypothetical protein EES39_18855 [Streptomyces sp. ADI92-24]